MKEKKKDERDLGGTFYISEVSKSKLTKEECQKSSADSSLKGLENALKNLKKK